MEYITCAAELITEFDYYEANTQQKDRFRIFYRPLPDRVEVVILVNDTLGILTDSDQSHQYINSVTAFFRGQENFRGKIVFCKMVVVTDDVCRSRNNLWEKDDFWLVDLNKQTLIIYENQKDDQKIIRQCLEAAFEKMNGITPKIEKDLRFSRVKRYILSFNFLMLFVNVLVYILMSVISDGRFTNHFLLAWGAESGKKVLIDHEFYRLLTSCFIHGDITHLFSNMSLLAYLGYYVECQIGHVKFLAAYLICGVLSGLAEVLWCYYVINEGDEMFDTISFGASGAVFAILGISFWLFICQRLKKKKITGQDIAFIALEVLLIVVSCGIGKPGIGYASHVAGVLTGFVFAVIFCRNMIRQKK